MYLAPRFYWTATKSPYQPVTAAEFKTNPARPPWAQNTPLRKQTHTKTTARPWTDTKIKNGKAVAIRKLKTTMLIHDKNKKPTLQKKLSRVSTRSVLGVLTRCLRMYTNVECTIRMIKFVTCCFEQPGFQIRREHVFHNRSEPLSILMTLAFRIRRERLGSLQIHIYLSSKSLISQL